MGLRPAGCVRVVELTVAGPIYRRMKTASVQPIHSRLRSGILAAAAAVLAVLSAAPALADCTEAAQPKVNWRRCSLEGQTLTGVDLSGAMLRDATFQRATLGEAKLTDADGYRAKFISATAPGAVFDKARLIEADFTRADLTGASFREADLRNAKMVGASLARADLTGARLSGTDLRHADLSGARWTDGTHICAESSVGQCN
ncbi:Pentapeptide repeat-containing protein [Azospirillum oryzae]|uniref:Pentapeptide repeat-containing protein n=2 Tax=Azospirillum oryzae TaxID=286727 RepID=A0A1X7GLA6_9PROT|nr:Pentapeptide repeat-containing protein [Azospirillum oryzae]